MKVFKFLLAGGVNATWNRTWQTSEYLDNDDFYEWHEIRLKMNFWETKYYCDSLGGGFRLPTPTSLSEDRIILGQLHKWRGNFFLGIAQEIEDGRNEAGENELDGVFEGEWPLSVQYDGGDWYNIYTGEKITYSRWYGQDAGGQPDNGHSKGNEHYAVVNRYDGGQWYDADIDGNSLSSPGQDFDSRETTLCMRKCTGNPDCDPDPDMFIYTTTTLYTTSTATTTTFTPNISQKCEAGSRKNNLKCADGYYCDNAIFVEGVYDTITQAGTCTICPESSEEFCKSQYFLRLVFKLITIRFYLEYQFENRSKF